MSINVDRMRRYAQRGREEQERREWWASLSPEHRAKHERLGVGAICTECVGVTMSRVAKAMQIRPVVSVGRGKVEG